MFGRKKCIEHDRIMSRMEDLEEKVKEANDPLYKKSKRIVSLQRLINPAESFHDQAFRSYYLLTLDEKAVFAKEVSDYYLELAKKYGCEESDGNTESANCRCRFTGLRDIHGDPIYVGDTVKCTYEDGISRLVEETIVVKDKNDPGRTNTMFNYLPIGWNGTAKYVKVCGGK